MSYLAPALQWLLSRWHTLCAVGLLVWRGDWVSTAALGLSLAAWTVGDLRTRAKDGRVEALALELEKLKDQIARVRNRG